MAQPNPQLERAKQGDPEAIAALMSRSLKPKGIEVRAESGGDVLQVTLEGAQPVNRTALVDFIRKGMMQLGIESLRAVQVDWRQSGSLLTEWTEEIPLQESGDFDFAAASLSQIDDPASEAGDASSLAGDPTSEVESATVEPNDKKSKKRKSAKTSQSSSPLVLVLGLVAIALGLWYFYREGKLDSVIAQLPASVQQFLPPSTGSTTDPEMPLESPSPEGEAEEAPEATAPAESPAPEAAPAPDAEPAPEEAPEAAAPAESPAPEATPAPDAAPEAAPVTGDFAAGVRNAMRAAELAQTAQTAAEWTAVAAEWEAAIAQFQAMPASDPNYGKAQERIPTYQTNLQYAQTNAENAAN